MRNVSNERYRLKQMFSGKLRFFVLIGVLILVGVFSILAYSADGNSLMFGDYDENMPSSDELESDMYYSAYNDMYGANGTIPIMRFGYPTPGYLSLHHNVNNPARPGMFIRNIPFSQGQPIDISFPIRPGLTMGNWVGTFRPEFTMPPNVFVVGPIVTIPFTNTNLRGRYDTHYTGQIVLPNNVTAGYLMAAFATIDIEYLDRDLNVDAAGDHRRAVVGYTYSDFFQPTHIRNIRSGIMQYVAPLRLQLNYFGEFNFGQGIYTDYTSQLSRGSIINPGTGLPINPGQGVCNEIIIYPRASLPAGLHTAEVEVWQDVFPFSHLEEDSDVETWSGGPLHEESWFDGTFEVTFLVERPVIRLDFSGQNRINTTLNAAYKARDVFDTCLDSNPNGDIVAQYLPHVAFITQGIEYFYLDPPNPLTSDIFVVLRSYNEYTFFHGPSGSGYYYQLIDVDPPQGYFEVPGTRHMYGNNLIITFRPLSGGSERFQFRFFKTCMLIEENPPIRNTLPGAVFRFDWEVDGVNYYYISNTTGSDGMVFIGYNEIIDLPPGQIVRFFIRELEAPNGFRVPDYNGYWYVDFCTTAWEFVNPNDPFTSSHPSNPSWVRLQLPPMGLSSAEDRYGYEDYYEAQIHGIIGTAPLIDYGWYWHIGNKEEIDEPTRYRITFFLNGAYDPNYGETHAIVRTNREHGYPIGVGGPIEPWWSNHNQYGAPYIDPALPANLAQAPLRFFGWVEIDEDGNRINPNAPPLQRDDFWDEYVTGNRYFKAVFGLHFEFIKTDMGIYEYPPEINPLDGAVFEIHWFNPDENDYEVLYISLPSSDGSCGQPGRVIIGDVHNSGHSLYSYNPRLEHSLTGYSFDRFRDFWLIEVSPPEPQGYYVLPPGGWRFYFDELNQMEMTVLGDFDRNNEVVGPVPPFRVINGTRYVGNRPFALEIIKATRYPLHAFLTGDEWIWETLPGATFILERQGWPQGQWDAVYTPAGEQLIVQSDSYGRIVIQYPIPAGSDGEFRLRELVAPQGFVLPQSGGWVITLDSYRRLYRLDFMDYDDSTAGCSFHGVFTYGVGWVIPNFPVRDWPVYKLDWIIHTDFYAREIENYLEGAVFRLYVYNGPIGTAPPLDMLVTSDMVGPANDGFMWSYVTTRISEGHGSLGCDWYPMPAPMMFPMMPGRHYQLVEISPPVGFMLPFGQWRISPISASPFPEGTDLVINAIDHAPPEVIEYRSVSIGSSEHPNPFVYIANRPIIEIPMAGGRGSSIFYTAAFALLGGAMGILFGTTIYKKRKARQ